MNRFLIALQFITRIPVKLKLNYEDKEVALSMLHYPLIGTILGLILVLINRIGSLYLLSLVTNSLLIIGMVVLTGGIHLDGLMDTCDGIFSGRDKEKILEIMRDSRVGAFGVIGLVSLFLVKFSLLVELPVDNKNFTLIYFPTISRWSIVYAAYFYPYARKEGLGKVYAQHLKLRDFLLASLWPLALGIFFFELDGLIIFASSWLMTVIIAKIITNKIDGLTGDNYGAINEIIEVGVLLVVLILTIYR